jgi:SpoVK/Ycf46/Vps4 family AAA+-type ATPase
MTDKERDIVERLDKYFYENPPSNECLLEIIKVAFQYGNVMNVSDYAKAKDITPQGVYACKNVQNENNIRFVIDNNL